MLSRRGDPGRHTLCVFQLLWDVLIVQVRNEGEVKVPNATLSVTWPHALKDASSGHSGRHILYLVHEPVLVSMISLNFDSIVSCWIRQVRYQAQSRDIVFDQWRCNSQHHDGSLRFTYAVGLVSTNVHCGRITVTHLQNITSVTQIVVLDLDIIMQSQTHVSSK